MAVDNTTKPDFAESDADDTNTAEVELDDGPGFDDEPEEDEAEESKDESADDSEDDDTDDFDEDESESEQAADDDEEEAKPESKAKPEKSDAPKLSDEEQRKAHNKAQAEARLSEKARREAAIQAEQEEYLAQSDPDDPKDAALRQLQIDAYNNKVEANTNKLTNGYERAVKDFPILVDSAPEVQQFVNEALDTFQALHVSLDKHGNPTTVNGDIYEYLQAKADSIANLTGRGARKQSADKTKQRSKALTTPSRPPKEAKKDDALDAFDEEARRW